LSAALALALFVNFFPCAALALALSQNFFPCAALALALFVNFFPCAALALSLFLKKNFSRCAGAGAVCEFSPLALRWRWRCP
jgi:hypothetical protein